MRVGLITLILTLTVQMVSSQIVVLPSAGEKMLTEGYQYLADPMGTLTPETVKAAAVDGRFRLADSLAWQDTCKVYWLHFFAANKTGMDREWIFDFENWSQVEFHYQEDSAGMQLKRTGHLYPYRKRDYPVANKNYIRLPVKNGAETECYVRLESKFNNEKKPQNLEFRVAPRAWIDQQAAQAGRAIYTFLGIFAVMFLYNFFVFLATRLRSYAYYLLVLFFALYHTSYNSGYLISIFGGLDAFPVWLSWFEITSSCLFGIAVTLFVQEYLKTRDRYPVWNRILNGFLVVYVIIILLGFVQFEISSMLSGLAGFAFIPVVLTLAIKSVLGKYPSAIYFLLGYTAFFLGIVVLMLTVLGILPYNDFNFNYALPLGTTVEIILFSFALANLINVLRRENEEKQAHIIAQLQENQELQTKVNRELEQKVQERTTEINIQKEEISRQKEALEEEKEKTDRLLLNILPAATANELKETGRATPKHYDNVTVLFTDFVGFTRISEQLSPDELVSELDFCFRAFDEIITRNHLEKIKTIGDAYMAAAGVPEPDANGAQNTVKAALEIKQFIEEWGERKRAKGEKPWELRIGIHTGPVTAGVVGKKKFAFDIWGDTVNTAAIMEARGIPGKLNVSESTYSQVRDLYKFTSRGKIEGKHKIEIDMFLLEEA